MLTLKKFDLTNDLKVVDESIQFRNTLLEALHPDAELAIAWISQKKIQEEQTKAAKNLADKEIKKLFAELKANKRDIRLNAKDIRLLAGENHKEEARMIRQLRLAEVQGKAKDEAIALLQKGIPEHALAGASGSRKHGDFFFHKEGTINPFETYFPTPMGQVNYGSILMTECKQFYSVNVKLLIVNDGELGTDDCHGKVSSQFLAKLRSLDSFEIPTLTPFQFRAGVVEQWVAKGTLAVSNNLGGDIEMVLPLSCFKGKDAEGNLPVKARYYEVEMKLGIVSFATKRTVKTSYTVWQWFSKEAIASDILPTAQRKAEKLLEAQADIKSLCALIKKEQWCAEMDVCEGETPEDERVLEAILKHDLHGQLVEHPYVVRKIEDLVRKRWLTLATSGGAYFHSFLAQPCKELGELEICVPDLPEGEYIGFRYPIRDKNDVQIWVNKHHPELYMQNTVYLNPTVFCEYCGGDFDGDTFCLASVKKFPAIAEEIRVNHSKPATFKPKKKPVIGTLAEVAIRSTDNQIGLIIYYLATAWATNNHEYIEGLAQEAQIAVDRLKSDLDHDQVFLDKVGKALPKLDWLLDRKKIGVYGSAYDPETHQRIAARPMRVGEWDDSISFLVTEINNLWQPLALNERKLVEFRGLFPKPGDELYKRAIARRNEFALKIKSAQGKSPDARKSILKKAAEWARNMGQYWREKGASQVCTSALWHACHNGAHGTAAIVFNMFLEEICEQLHTQQFSSLTIIGSQYGEFPYTEWTGEGEHAQVPIAIAPRADGRLQVLVKIGEALHSLGILAQDSAKIAIGEYRALLRTRKASILATIL